MRPLHSIVLRLFSSRPPFLGRSSCNHDTPLALRHFSPSQCYRRSAPRPQCPRMWPVSPPGSATRGQSRLDVRSGRHDPLCWRVHRPLPLARLGKRNWAAPSFEPQPPAGRRQTTSPFKPAPPDPHGIPLCQPACRLPCPGGPSGPTHAVPTVDPSTTDARSLAQLVRAPFPCRRRTGAVRSWLEVGPTDRGTHLIWKAC